MRAGLQPRVTSNHFLGRRLGLGGSVTGSASGSRWDRVHDMKGSSGKRSVPVLDRQSSAMRRISKLEGNELGAQFLQWSSQST